MSKTKYIFVILAVMCLIAAGCEKQTAAEITELSGGLPTPNSGDTLSDYGQSVYGREREEVDYDRISEDEYRIRAVIETKGLRYHKNPPDEDKLLRGVEKYGVSTYNSIDDIVMFSDVDSMKIILQNKNFLLDYEKETGIPFKPDAFYLPKSFEVDRFIGTLIALDNKPYFELFGRVYTEDKDYYSAMWSVYAVPDGPSAKEIASFYAKVDGLKCTADEGKAATVYHFTASNGCAFFEKFGVETNDSATAYFWEQNNVIGVIILPGEHKPENLDLCVLEKHEL